MKHSFPIKGNPTKIRFSHLRNDVLCGVIIALVSIPISMGYAQIAGLPAVYGLYGSFLPVLVFCLLTSSPRFVIGVDAMPAVMVGNLLSQLGIAALSPEAMETVPVIALLCAAWFVVFRLIRAGRAVKYISNPVMGGFISGIGCTIILMQVPKLFGGAAGTGELIPLAENILAQLPGFHPLSALLGFGTIAIILIAKRLKPKFPMTVVMMVVGILLISVFHLDAYGVKTLPAAESGLPKLLLPKLSVILRSPREFLTVSLTISLVIMAQSLLATNSYAAKYGDVISQDRELLAYAAMNIAGCAVGCCPINGSVSRTGMADQLGVKSQLMGLTATVTMVLLLLFGTGLLAYLPVPVLTGIVTTALIGIIDTKMAKRLWKTDRMEFAIFVASFCGVLLLGTIYGVVIGVVLSFFDVIRIAVVPPRGFIGVLPGHEGFYNLERTGEARPISGVMIYRFSGNLFFANITTFREDILRELQPTIHTVIIDGRGISDIDITAADSLLSLYRELKQKNVAMYLTEHVGAVNDALRRYGAEELIREGAVRRNIETALSAIGLEPPYPVENAPEQLRSREIPTDRLRVAEFEWLFGDEMEDRLQEAALEIAEELVEEDPAAENGEEELVHAERRSHWKTLTAADEDELLPHLELRLEKLAEEGRVGIERLRRLEHLIEQREHRLDDSLRQEDPALLERIIAHRKQLDAHAAQLNPKLYRKHLELHEHLHQQLQERQAELEKRFPGRIPHLSDCSDPAPVEEEDSEA